MISTRWVKKYCKEDISLIENYEEAINDTTQSWDCHHRTEIWWNCSVQELNDNECYYNRPAKELIFLTHAEHIALHKNNNTNWLGKKHTKEQLLKMSKSMKGKNKGKHNKLGHTTSVFGNKFKEHYNINPSEDRKLYDKEWKYFKSHSICRWEV